MRKLILLSVFAFAASLKRDPSNQATLVDIRRRESQQWGVVNTRVNANLFYWFHNTTHVDGYQNRPIVLWLQGGPGCSSTGYGSFGTIGPINELLEERENSWVQSANLLFVDSPVGTGFSWCDSLFNCYNQNGYDTADDMAAFLNVFFDANPEFRENEFYIFGQGYGGKMAATIARRLYNDIQLGWLDMNLKGLAMGNAFTRPFDSMLNWGELLYWMSAVDAEGKERIDASVRHTQEAMERGNWTEANIYFDQTQEIVWDETNGIEFTNIQKYITNSVNRPAYEFCYYSSSEPYVQSIYNLMNRDIKEQLEILPDQVVWGISDAFVYVFQGEDFLRDAVSAVEWVLNNSDMQVVIYQGQLDLFSNTKGARDWVQRINWPGIAEYNAAERKAFVDPVNGQTDTYVKAHRKFKFYEILRAGNAVPAEAPEAALRMLNRILDDLDN